MIDVVTFPAMTWYTVYLYMRNKLIRTIIHYSFTLGTTIQGHYTLVIYMGVNSSEPSANVDYFYKIKLSRVIIHNSFTYSSLKTSINWKQHILLRRSGSCQIHKIFIFIPKTRKSDTEAQ